MSLYLNQPNNQNNGVAAVEYTAELSSILEDNTTEILSIRRVLYYLVEDTAMKNTKVIGGITYTKFKFASGGFKYISPTSARNRELAATLREYNAHAPKPIEWAAWKKLNAKAFA